MQDTIEPLTAPAVVDAHDAALTARLRSGDADAWALLYDQLHGPLTGYAMRQLASVADAEEVVSESFARAVDAIPRFDPLGGGLRPWLFGITRNVIRERWRQAARDASWTRRLTPEPDPDDPVEMLLAREQREALWQAFAMLSGNDQELLELRVVVGLSAEEVAAIQGRRPGSVRMAHSRALRRLRAHLPG